MKYSTLPTVAPAESAPPAPKRSVLRGVVRAVVVVAIFLFGVLVGSAGSSDPAPAPSTDPAASVSASAPAPSAEASAPASAPAPSAAVSAPVPATAGTITNGEWLVGDEVAPGTYRSPGPTAGPVRLAMITVTDASDKIVSAESSNDGPIRITVAAGQTIKVIGSQPLVRVG